MSWREPILRDHAPRHAVCGARRQIDLAVVETSGVESSNFTGQEFRSVVCGHAERPGRTCQRRLSRAVGTLAASENARYSPHMMK
jgi:hypothetical protein